VRFEDALKDTLEAFNNVDRRDYNVNWLLVHCYGMGFLGSLADQYTVRIEAVFMQSNSDRVGIDPSGNRGITRRNHSDDRSQKASEGGNTLSVITEIVSVDNGVVQSLPTHGSEPNINLGITPKRKSLESPRFLIRNPGGRGIYTDTSELQDQSSGTLEVST